MPWWLYAIAYATGAMITFRIAFVQIGETREEFFKVEGPGNVVAVLSVIWPLTAFAYLIWGTGMLLTFPTRKQRREIKAKKDAAEIDLR